MNPALPVVPNGAQDCSTCPHLSWCWKDGLSEPVIVSHLLTCRIQRDIARDKSIKLFLELVRPKVRKMAAWVHQRTAIDMDEIVADMESTIVESLCFKYKFGSVAPLVWLFHERLGAVRHWAIRTVYDTERRNNMFFSYDETRPEMHEAGGADVFPDLERSLRRLNTASTRGRIHTLPLPQEEAIEGTDEEIVELCARALEVVEDGVTLPVAEYRVLKFCLQNTRDFQNLTQKLHKYMAGAFGQRRKVISHLYGMATRRLLAALGLHERYLRNKGLTPPKTRRADPTRPLSDEEIIGAAEILGESAPILDIALALGVADRTVRRLRARFQGMSPDEIRAALRRRNSA